MYCLVQGYKYSPGTLVIQNCDLYRICTRVFMHILILRAQISQQFGQKHACDTLCYYAVVMILQLIDVNRDESCLVFLAEESLLVFPIS